jgi:hypothetical protein
MGRKRLVTTGTTDASSQRWDRVAHPEKGLVVKNQWEDLKPFCDITLLREMALIGPNLETHLSESNSEIIIPIEFDYSTAEILTKKANELPLINRNRIPIVLRGEFFDILINTKTFEKYEFTYLDFDGMCGYDTAEHRTTIAKSLKHVLDVYTPKQLIIRFTFIQSLRCAHTNGIDIIRDMSKLGFFLIPAKFSIKNNLESSGFINNHDQFDYVSLINREKNIIEKMNAPKESCYYYRNQGRMAHMLTNQFIYVA